MKILLRLFLAFSLIASLCLNAAAQDDSSLRSETRLLESELSLAKKAGIYFIFDLENNKVLLKSRGVVLREMKIEDMRFWGQAVNASPRPLMGKSALFKEPERVNIDPNKAKEEETASPASPATTPGAFEIEALELKDMPTIYHLEFQEGIFISVRPTAASGFVSKLYAVANYTGWYVSRPLITIWHSIKGRPFTSIYLSLNEEDARSIYWSLVEKSENIINYP